MTLPAGFCLGPYELIAPLGAGGMGEVYKAKDTRLERIVAVKVLPARLSSSPETRQRFEREAKTISQLSHPHVCALYDVGNQDGVEYLVMEYLEGQTLADRLVKGPLPLEQTLRYGAEIAEALDSAHRRGIVHRDLKPANVMLTSTGVKLVDFGLAKFAAAAAGSASAPASVLLTQAPSLTQEGTILGTFQYMAPEQLEGKEADARTDLFAFGALLHEMATGQKAFSGHSQASLIAAILERQPPAISSIQPMTPAALDRVVKTCLAKDPEDRFQTAHDARLELQWAMEGGAASAAAGATAGAAKSRERLAWILASALALGLAAALFLLFRQPPRNAGDRRAMTLSLLPPDKTAFHAGNIALSPDGTRLAFIAAGAEGRNVLWIRSLDSLEARPLPGTERAFSPFWSPDGRFVAFFAQGKLKKIEASGGPPQVLCDARLGRGGTWNRDGVIVFAPVPTLGLFRVSAAGGEPVPLTKLDPSRQENSHRWPAFLPDGRHFLFFARSTERDHSVYTGSLDSKDTKRLMGGNSNVIFARASGGEKDGYLLFERDGSLMARRFDTARLEFTGEPETVARSVKGTDPLRSGMFTVSDTGLLAYGNQSASDLRQLSWVDRGGKLLGTIGSPGLYIGFRLAPDDQRLAMDMINPSGGGGREIWLMELSRGVTTRLTIPPAVDLLAVWSPDGTRLAYATTRDAGVADLYTRPASGDGTPELLLKSSLRQVPSDWSRDGRFLLYDVGGPRAKSEIWILPLSGDRTPTPLLRVPFNVSQGSFSPDGHWFAYVSDESGRPEVYVQTNPVSAAKWRISTEGGAQPEWGRDGKEIFYIAPDGRLMSVEVSFGSTLVAASPRALFRTEQAIMDVTGETFQYSVSSDSQRFVVHAPVQGPPSQPITVVVDWMADLKKRT